MTNTTSNTTSAKPEVTAETRQIVLKDIRAKWDKFSEHDLSALKGNDDLVNQVVAKYGLEKTQAQRDVDALLKGRHI
jgi:division protein CdvB (Snf7/Vps24/ESCRT-III family)